MHKALVGIRDRFAIDVEDGADLKAQGNIVDHEYEIERDGDSVARSRSGGSASATRTASRSSPARTTSLMLAIVVAIESLTETFF